jgi:phosphoenolpyruvate carboxykinase (ATP)
MVRAALSGALDDVEYETDPVFGVEVPTSCPDVPAEFLRPRDTWPDGEAYDRQAASLARMFAENFAAFADGVSESVRASGPRVSGEAGRLEEAGPGEG